MSLLSICPRRAGSPFPVSGTNPYFQKLDFLRCCSILIVLLQFTGFIDTNCVAPLQCITIENCSLALGEKTDSHILFPCGPRNRNVCCPVRQSASAAVRNKMSLLPLDICGVSTEDKIIGGEAAGPGQFPWMALLGYRVRNSNALQFLCGGSIINHRYILTAAHCLKLDVAKLESVRLGEVNLTGDPDCESFCPPSGCQEFCADPVQNYEVESVIVHEKYSTANLKNDIGLIRLKKNIPSFKGEFIRPLCLPIGLNITGYEETKYKVAGWGKTDHYKTTGSTILQHATIQGIPIDDCDALQTEEVRPLDETQLCAGNTQGRDACKGDSGGPLMYIQNSTGKLYQVGIVSFGSVPCGGKDAPSVYTRVSSYINWILSNIQESET